MKITINELTKLIKKSINENINNRYTYDAINRGNSSFGNIAKGFQGKSISFSPDKMIYSTFLNEGIDFRPDDNERGGIIVFSTDVNAVMLDNRKIINFLKQKLETIKNRLNFTKKVDKIAAKNNLVGWTIGHYLNGRYTAKNGKQYGENSISVEIIGVESSTLKKIAEELCDSFSQESVLLKDYNTGEIFFMNSK